MKAVDSCLKEAEIRIKENKLLSDSESIFIQFTVVKKPVTYNHSCRLYVYAFIDFVHLPVLFNLLC